MDLKQRSEELRTMLLRSVEEYQQKLKTAIEDEERALKIIQSKESQTDRSENATFIAARDAAQLAQVDIAAYSTRLDLLRNFTYEYTPRGVITTNTTVLFEVLDNTGKFSKEYSMLVVAPGLGDASKSLLDLNAPLGKALCGKSANETVSYQSMTGWHNVRIKEIY